MRAAKRISKSSLLQPLKVILFYFSGVVGIQFQTLKSAHHVNCDSPSFMLRKHQLGMVQNSLKPLFYFLKCHLLWSSAIILKTVQNAGHKYFSSVTLRGSG